jgi:iron complex outermembrane receptor protein
MVAESDATTQGGIMNKRFTASLLAATSLTGVVLATSPAFAQDNATTLGEIVVTARRSAENVQNIPVTVQAISGATIERNAITQFTEVAKLAPGLQLSFASGSRGSNAEVTLRGVRWSSASGSVAIPIYINEVEVDPNFALLSLYDVGQLEVLRGPQGTTRGAPSISGAVTLTTRPVNLETVGGYASGLLGEHSHANFQGAINLPIITDKLGIRIAAMGENSQSNGVRSLNNPLDPKISTKAARITILAKPIDGVTLNVSYQHLENLNQTYDQVVGNGSPGFTTPAGSAAGQTTRVLAPGYNGPVIRSGDHLAVNDVRSHLNSRSDLVTLTAAWDVLGHTLEYIGGLQKNKFSGPNSQDPGNTIIGYDPVQGITGDTYDRFTQELRLSSNPGDHFIDYVAGAYLFHSKGETDVAGTAAYLGGAFAPPGQTQSPIANLGAVDRYRLPQSLFIPIKQITYSFYASATLHLPWDTELTGGIRKIHDHRVANTAIYLGPGTTAIASPVCPASGSVSALYGPGYCDIPVARSFNNQFPADQTRTPTLYNVSLSHRFTPDILGYATVGSSYRAPGTNIGLLVGNTSILFPRPERATSYELGFKTTWMDRRLRLNGDVFQINYKGQLAQFPSINYRNVVTGATTALSSTAFYQNINSRVRGFELEAAFEPVHNLTLTGNAAYAKITSKGGPVPCNNPAVPLTATNEMNFCPLAAGVVLNTMPKFNATLNGEYIVPLEQFNGYLRGNVAYRGKNPNYGFLASVPSYTLVDAFAGVRSLEGDWELGLYAKNIFDKRVELTRTNLTTNLVPANGALAGQFGPAGYFAVTSNMPREVGVQMRYAFGSR